MKNCNDCIYAEWKRTKAGRLHPSGDGRCTYPIKIPKLPPCYYFLHYPNPLGGYINRRTELKEHCTYYQQKKD